MILNWLIAAVVLYSGFVALLYMAQKVRTYRRKRDVASLPCCFSVGAPAPPLLKGVRRERIAP